MPHPDSARPCENQQRAGVRLNNKKPRRASQTATALALVWLCALSVTAHAQINRQQAVTALFAPGSGVVIDVTNSTVWSPYVNYGFGAGREGLLPPGAQVSPKETGWPPFPGPGMTVSNASYFFWIDDEPAAGFQHPVRFVLLDAFHGSPSVSNGAIRVRPQGWWPVVSVSNGVPVVEYFSTDAQRTSASPPGATNADGFVAEFAPNPADFQLLSTTTNPGGAGPPAALIVRGSPDVYMANDATIFENDLREHYGVNGNRIIKANNGLPATRAQLATAISNLCNLQPPPNKIFIRLTSHGSDGGFRLADGTIGASELRTLLQPIADKKVPICLLIEACHSGSLIPALSFGFPSNSTVISSTSKEQMGWQGAFQEGTAGTYVLAFSQALRANPASNPGLDLNGDGFVDDREAHAWVVQQKPGFTSLGSGKIYYPAGPPLGQIGDNPNPQIRVVGGNPLVTSRQVRNSTIGDKTDFHITAMGNVTNGIKTFSTRVALDGLPLPALGFTNPPTVTFDAQKNGTQIAWEDTNSPVPPGSLILVTVFHPQGDLHGFHSYWTPTPAPFTSSNRVPGGGLFYRIREDGTNMAVHITNPNPADDQPGESQDFHVRVGYAPKLFRLDEFYSANPDVTNLPAGTNLTFTLLPNADREFEAPMPTPPGNAPLPSVVFRIERSWSLNSNWVTELSESPLPLPPQDTTSLTNCPGSGVFMTVNPPGPNSFFQWYKDGQPIPGATNTTLLLTNLQLSDSAIYTGISTNSTSVKRKFFILSVVDTVPPVINCPSNIVVQCSGPGGTAVNFGVSAGDNCGSTTNLQCSPPPGSLFPPGTTVVHCAVMDRAGNLGECSFTVTVVDTTPPQISCLSDRVFTAGTPIIFNFSIGAGDNCDTNLAIQCIPPSGSTFNPNTTTTVTCTATDDNGNMATCSFKVTVVHPNGPDLRASLTNGQVRLTWSAPNALLERASQVTGPWTTTSNPSPYIVTPPQQGEFFRLLFP